jgi:uncharacterized membrane protein
VTFAGTLAEIAGAACIAAVAALTGAGTWTPIFIAGVTGATLDSVLGGTLQHLRRCPRCARACETNPHACGERTEPLRGAAWFNNDAVNTAATICGAGLAYMLSATGK